MSSAGKALSSWLGLALFRKASGHLLGKSRPLGFVYDSFGVICWERAVILAFVCDSFGVLCWERAGLLALFRIASGSSVGKDLAYWLCLR